MGFIKPEPENPGPPKILESEKIKPIYLNKYYIPVNGFYRFFLPFDLNRAIKP